MINALFIGASPQTAEVASRIRERWPEAKSLVADGGADGLKLAEQSSPDLVFIYSDLPDMSLSKAIWELRHISDVLVVVLSHNEDEKDKVKQLNLGADHYVMLPSTTTTRYEKTRSGLLLQLRTVHHGRLALVRCQLQNPPTSYLVG